MFDGQKAIQNHKNKNLTKSLFFIFILIDYYIILITIFSITQVNALAGDAGRSRGMVVYRWDVEIKD